MRTLICGEYCVCDSSTTDQRRLYIFYGSQDGSLRRKLPPLGASLVDTGKVFGDAASLSFFSFSRMSFGGRCCGLPLRFFPTFPVWVAWVTVAGGSLSSPLSSRISGSFRASHELYDRVLHVFFNSCPLIFSSNYSSTSSLTSCFISFFIS